MRHGVRAVGISSLALAMAAGTAMAQGRAAGTPTRLERDAITGGEALPRSLTPAERAFIQEFPLGSFTDAPTPPPTGPIKCVGEYEPMEGLIFSWTGSAGWLNILAQMGRRVTVEGQSRVYIGVPSATFQNDAVSRLTAQGADLSRVTFFTVPLNAIWVRDYGPRYIYEGNVRAIVDHEYNRPRPLDNQQPIVYGNLRQHQRYELGLNGVTLVHGGGNYHLSGLVNPGTGRVDGFATQLIQNENPGFTAAQIQQIWRTYQGVDTQLTAAFPTSVDATQHIDMWMQIIDDRKVVLSDWPNNPGSVQDTICDNQAAAMAAAGWTVTRVPAYSINGSHYTFTNMVMCNNVVLVPSYTVGAAGTASAAAATTIQNALAGTGKTVYTINCDAIVTAAGVMHCIVMHVPAHRGAPAPGGGLAPTAYLRGPNGGETLSAGQQFTIAWVTDDDAPVATTAGVAAVDVQLSTDGGATWPTLIAANQPALGSLVWNVPAGVNTATARVRVVARDAAGNTGSDASDANFTIGNPAAACYANCDGSTSAPTLNALDFGCFLSRYVAGEAYANCDGSTSAPALNALDFGCFLDRYRAGCN